MNARPNPYVGPRAFRTGETLYGRDRETLDLLDLLIAERVLLLYAPSGAGKTSLVRAALIPRLKQEAFTVLPVMRVNQPPPIPTENRYALSLMLSLEEAVPEAQQHPLQELADLELDAYLDRRQAALEPEDGRPPRLVLIFDQFEEILTLNPTDRATKRDFFAQVGQALRNRRRWALFSMREDYVAGLDPYLGALPTRLATSYRMNFLEHGPAMDAIRKPAQAAGVDFVAAAARKLGDDLRRVRVQEADGTTRERPGPYIEPVQLQVVCRWLWQRLPDDATAITPDFIAGLTPAEAREGATVSNVDRALAGYYADRVQAVVAELQAEAPDAEVSERAVRAWVDAQLITPQGIRGQVLLDRVGGHSAGLDNRAISKLVDAHLVRAEQRRGATWFELAHDRLIEPVRRDNAAWREAHLRPFQHRAAQWLEEDRPHSLLLQGEPLERAQRWAEAHPDMLTPPEQAFLTASQVTLERVEARRSRRVERRTNLADTGWGVIFAAEDPQAEVAQAALAELLDHRRREATEKHPDYYRVFAGAEGYRPGESATQFLARHGVGAGLATPDKMPTYLLIVGSPQHIPYEVQYELDVQYTVGRLHFEEPVAYARYARSVVQTESGAVALPRRAAFFGPQPHGDRAAQLSVSALLRPLADALKRERTDWEIQWVAQAAAHKARLARLLGGAETPTLFFTAGRAMETNDADDPRLDLRGALICQDWPGAGTPITAEHYFAADDVPHDARLLGLIAVLVAPSSAGVPHLDNFAHRKFQTPQPVAPHAFVSRLPQRLLGHPQGGALAVIGHVQTLWSYSLVGEREVREYGVFESLLKRLMRGHTVGSAMEFLNQRYAQLSSRLSEALQQRVFHPEGQSAPDRALVDLMTATVDARNYIVLGDPAARLPLGEGTAAAPHPVIEPVTRTFATPTPPETVPTREPAPVTEHVVFNGVNGATGAYLLPPMTVAQIAEIARGGPLAEDLETWYRRTGQVDL